MSRPTLCKSPSEPTPSSLFTALIRMGPCQLTFLRIVGLLLLGLLLVPTNLRQVSANAAKCNSCGNLLTGKFIHAGFYKFHPKCFKCEHCQQGIDVEFRQKQSKFFHTYCFKKIQGLICRHCSKILPNTWIDYKGSKYHESCYRLHIQPHCDVCRRAIKSQFTEKEGKKYHLGCYRNHVLPKCVICVRPLDDIFLIDPWGNQFHERHDNQTPICFSCGRVISKATSNGGRRLPDGRFICGICDQTSVSTSNQVRNARDSALKILSSIGIGDFPREVGIRLVDRLELNRLTKGMSLHTQGEMRGLTKSLETLEDNRRVSSRHTIFLLKDLPALELQGILAHELMHVWLFEKNAKLNPRDTEGFCNLGNYLVFSRNPSSMASYLLKNLETDADPVYGEGFRLQKRKVNELGWPRFLAAIIADSSPVPQIKRRLFQFGKN